MFNMRNRKKATLQAGTAAGLSIAAGGAAGHVGDKTISYRRTGKVLWGLWMTMMSLQWLLMATSLLMVLITFFCMRSQYQPLHDRDQQWLQVPRCSCLVYPSLSTRCCSQATDHALLRDSIPRQGGVLYGALTRTNVDCMDRLAVAYSVAFLCANGLFLLLWAVSLSWLMGIVFFLPLALSVGVGVRVVIVAGSVICMRKLVEDGLRSASLPERVKSFFLRPLNALIGWVDKERGGGRQGLFGVYCAAAVATVLSPLIVYSTWAMFFIYAGNSTSDVMTLLKLAYEHAFGTFINVRFSWWHSISTSPMLLPYY